MTSDDDRPVVTQASEISPAPAGRIRVLALHGFSGLPSDFEPLQRQLADGPATEWIRPALPFHLVLPLREEAQAGLGVVEKAEPLARVPRDVELEPAALPRHEEVMPDVVAWCETLVNQHILPHTQTPWVLLGYSMGARLALHILEASTRRHLAPGAMVLISGSPGLEDLAERDQRRQLDAQRACQLLELGTRRFLQQWDAMPLLASQTRAFGSTACARLDRRAQYDARSLAFALTSLSPGRLTAMGDVAAQYRGETLLVSGSQDEKYSEIARRWSDQLYDSRHVMVPGGHAAHVEAAPELASQLREVFHRRGFSLQHP